MGAPTLMIYGEREGGVFIVLPTTEDETFVFRHDGYQQGIFQEGKPFYPLVGETILPISLDLTWRSPLRFNIDKVPPQGLLLWHLDLGIEGAKLPLTDEGQFLAQVRAVEEFTRQVYEPLQGR